MKNLFGIAGILMALLVGFGCDKKSDHSPATTLDFVANSRKTTANFPTAIGSVWRYQTFRIYRYLDRTADDTVQVFNTTTTLIQKISIVGYSNVFEFLIESIPQKSKVTIRGGDSLTTDSTPLLTRYWYVIEGSSVKQVAHVTEFDGPVISPRIRVQKQRQLFFHESTSADTLLAEKIILTLPLQRGDKWTAFQDPFDQKITVVEQGLLNINFNTHQVFRLHHVNFIGDEQIGDYFSYYDGHGLVAREVIEPDNELTDTNGSSSGNGIFFDFIEQTRLVSFD